MRKSCLAFDLSPPEDKGKQQCHLYGHKSPDPASGTSFPETVIRSQSYDF
jgi:hypothetical protein